MRIGITVGQIGNKFDVVAMPDKHVREQRDVFISAIKSGGVINGKKYDKIIYFDEARKVKKFHPEVQEVKSEIQEAKRSRRQ